MTHITAPIDSIGYMVPLMRSLANETRLTIFLYLLNDEKMVSALESELGVKQPNLSQHLREMREVGLISARKQAKSVFYSLTTIGRIYAAALLDIQSERYGTTQAPIIQHQEPEVEKSQSSMQAAGFARMK